MWESVLGCGKEKKSVGKLENVGCLEGVGKCVGMWRRYVEMWESVRRGVKKCVGVWGRCGRKC